MKENKRPYIEEIIVYATVIVAAVLLTVISILYRERLNESQIVIYAVLEMLYISVIIKRYSTFKQSIKKLKGYKKGLDETTMSLHLDGKVFLKDIIQTVEQTGCCKTKVLSIGPSNKVPWLYEPEFMVMEKELRNKGYLYSQTVNNVNLIQIIIYRDSTVLEDMK